jgi:hypothetical protein
MLAIAILAAAAGLVLGLRFNVITFALLVLATAVIFAVSVWGGSNLLVGALQLLATLASVQISYLVGCLLAHIFQREPRRPPTACRERDICTDNLRRKFHGGPKSASDTCESDGLLVTYGFRELDLLVPAYAATIHKSQGSEYPAVIIPVLTQHYAMLQRNLLYTGVTEASDWWCWSGKKKAITIDSAAFFHALTPPVAIATFGCVIERLLTNLPLNE